MKTFWWVIRLIFLPIKFYHTYGAELTRWHVVCRETNVPFLLNEKVVIHVVLTIDYGQFLPNVASFKQGPNLFWKKILYQGLKQKRFLKSFRNIFLFLRNVQLYQWHKLATQKKKNNDLPHSWSDRVAYKEYNSCLLNIFPSYAAYWKEFKTSFIVSKLSQVMAVFCTKTSSTCLIKQKTA